jgi:hypothetical protein
MPPLPRYGGTNAKIVDGRDRAFLAIAVPLLVRIGNFERKNISPSGAGALSAIDESTTDTMVLWTFSHQTPPEQRSSASLRQRYTSGRHRA